MPLSHDSFGTYGQGSARLPLRAVRALDKAVTWAIGLLLALALAVSGYALWDSARVFDTSLTDGNGNALTFAQALAANPDVCAWITVPNTNIDYPVVRGSDDFEYLDKDALGNPTASGAIFLGSECSTAFDEPYELMMGHHMQYGKMFGDLDKFLDEGFFNQNQQATLRLPSKTLNLQICAVLKADAYDGVLFSMPATQARMQPLVQRIAEVAVFQRDGLPTEQDQVIALSTCASSGTNDRTILICRVADEHEEDNVSKG